MYDYGGRSIQESMTWSDTEKNYCTERKFIPLDKPALLETARAFKNTHLFPFSDKITQYRKHP